MSTPKSFYMQYLAYLLYLLLDIVLKVWSVSGVCLEGVWRCLEGVNKLSGRCLKGVLKVSGKCLEDVWIMPGSCLEGIW